MENGAGARKDEAEGSSAQLGGRSVQRRTTLLLTLALVPLGALSIVQTLSPLSSAETLAHQSLRAKTAEAAAPQREAIVAAFAAARSFAAALPETGMDGPACAALATRIAGGPRPYAFVGTLGFDAVSTCNNFGTTYDVSDDEAAVALLADPKPDVSYIEQGDASGQSVVIVSQPVEDAGGAALGLVSISFPVAEIMRPKDDDLPVELVTFNDTGRVLTSDLTPERSTDLLPEEQTLAALADGKETVFDGVSQTGKRRTYAIVPILDGMAYALGIWVPPARPLLTAFLLPVLMWLVTLGIVVYVLREMVVRPVTDLKSRMAAFARVRDLSGDALSPKTSREFHEMQDAFDAMAMRILRDEAEAEDKLKERGLLLQELHHRVSNNLQLMSSILNMQMRKTDDPKLEAILANIQRRLSSIARFHNELYQNDFSGTLDASPLLRDVLDSLVVAAREAGIEIDHETNLPPLPLAADQASHAALYVFEAVSFAIGLMARREAVQGRLALSLTDGEEVDLTLVSEPALETPDDMSVEERLIGAFAAQLRGKSEAKRAGDTLTQHLTFPTDPDDHGGKIPPMRRY